MKKLGLISALGALFYCSVVLAAGTIPFSLSQQLDEFGKPLAGCRLYIIQAGTVSTPQNAYQDSALTIPWPNPLTCDASGRLPQLFIADGSVKIRLTKSNGTNVVTADGILVVGASSGGGGGSPVDATTILATGDVKVRYGTGVLSGFVRLNGRTIGSSTSGATERANADVQALFEYLWSADATLAVSGGRGASANADWVANKTLTLPDMRGRMIAGLDDMGNSAASRLTATTCATPTMLGTGCGTETKAIAQANLPSGVTLTTTIASGQGSHNHTAINSTAQIKVFVGAAGTSGTSVGGTEASVPFTDNATLPAMSGTTPLGGSGTALGILPPVMLVTTYIKL